MNRLGLAVIAATCIPFWGAVACAALPAAQRPPLAFQTPTVTTVKFSNNVKADCFGNNFAACTFGRLYMVIPNPCNFSGELADYLCHELGHINGWNHEGNANVH